jgi:hypothetical protein
MRILRLVAVVAGVAAAVPAAADPSPLKPFAADYVVLRDGKELGEATLSLDATGGDTWEFSSRTHGTGGMAGMLGLDVEEHSTFRWRGGAPESLAYRYSQKAAIKSRRRSIEFDWNARTAYSDDGKRHFEAPLTDGAMDRSVVTIALMAALKAHADDPSFPVVDKDRVADQRFRIEGKEALSLPSGPVNAVRVERIRDDANKATTIWFAPHLEWLPVQIEQAGKDGVITMRFVHGR